MERTRDGIRLLAVVLTGPVSRRPVRPLGDEDRRPLPGDELLPVAKGRWTHAITIRGRPGDIWPWLVQMGCRRGGWYSYDGLDNGGVPSADRIVPDLQRAEVGDILPWTPSTRLITRATGEYELFAVGLMLKLVWRPQRRQLINLKRRVEAAAA